MTKKTRTYSTEFKAEAVKKIVDNNGNVSATTHSVSSHHTLIAIRFKVSR